jgi:TolB-like protein/tetratricopeptide (TPR) repeat protein
MVERVERRLTAILAADVAGYSTLSSLDEEGTHARLKDHLGSLLEPKIAEHHGRTVKNTGDGLLAEFASVVDAVRCALEIQRGMAERNEKVPQDNRIEFRIGINVGDIILDRGDIFGDGVNVTARLEALAEPGGICLSDDAQRQVRGKLDIGFEDVGERQLKNIPWPVRIYRVRPAGPTNVRAALAIPEKPSIAVLPFQNLSGDPEQEYFADGIVEDIVTELSRFRNLFVISRNSSFTYKGRAVEIKQVGRELGVRYVLEGSVRRAADRVRITAQLIDAVGEGHLWADRFDGALEDVFELQDRVTARVVGAIAPKLEQEAIECAKRKPTDSLDAYDCYLRAHASIHPWTRAGNEEALRLFCRAIELDPTFAAAYGMAAWCRVQRKASGWLRDRADEIAETRMLALRAAELGKDDAATLGAAGFALVYVVHDVEPGLAFIDRALALNPNLAWVWLYSGWARVWLGKPDLALEHLARATRLSPLDPLISDVQVATAHAHFFCGRYQEAASWAAKVVDLHSALYHIAAAANALAGHMQEARKACERLRQLHPALRIAGVKQALGPYRPEDLAKYEEGLRRAGLPE